MGRVTALFIRKVLIAAGDEVDAPALLRSAGLAPTAEAELGEMIDAETYYDLLERIAAQLSRPERLPLDAGRSMRCDDYGAFGLAWKAAPTLRGSIERAERYARLLTTVAEYELEPDAAGGYMRLHRDGARRLGLRLSNEATLASIVALIREVSPAPFRPLEAHFKHPPPARVDAHLAYFGVEPIFRSDRDALLIAEADLARANRLGDAGITRFLLRHLEAELAETAQTPQLQAQVRQAIARALSAGPPKMAEIARRLGVSPRTLHRRLAGEGVSFQDLADEARRELAEGLLRDSDYPLAEIAYLTGFSEQSAFTRAFRRWRDETPAAYRAAAAAAHGS